MTHEETAETFRSKLNGGPDARDAAIAEIASAIREAVEAEREKLLRILARKGHLSAGDLRSCSEKPPVTPKEGA